MANKKLNSTQKILLTKISNLAKDEEIPEKEKYIFSFTIKIIEKVVHLNLI
jgi:uncharacterized protein affecting Mg2+/Co2+ transport